MNSPKKAEKFYPPQYHDQNWYSMDTIVAISTPEGKGGIGIIRISGNKAQAIVKNIFRKSRKKKDELPIIKSHQVYYGHIVDPENEEEIDEVIIVPMIAPKSYTREDVVEIQCHSGSAVIEKILEIIINEGARIAEPGEFTKRAFINGRIDLTQAEAVIDIINAENENSRKIANKQLTGALRDQLISIKTNLIKSLAEIEAEIDFSEDQGELFLENTSWRKDILDPLNKLKENAEVGLIIKNGTNVVLVGKPNVGKSSLMNRLLKQDRAIVTPFPGTTRDHIEDGFEIEGIKIRLIDTAGIHKSQNPVEVLGIRKTKKIIKKAGIILFICDLSTDITKEDEDIFKIIENKKKIIVFNKKDLFFQGQKQKIPLKWKTETQIKISALKNHGINELKKVIANKILENKDFDRENLLITNFRQKTLIENASIAIQKAIVCHKKSMPMEIIAIEFKEALCQINSALGVEVSDDIIDLIFRNFCIGK